MKTFLPCSNIYTYPRQRFLYFYGIHFTRLLSQFHGTCTIEQVKAEIKNFHYSSAARPDGLRPRHLKTLLGLTSSAQVTRLLTILTNLINDVLGSWVPKHIWPLFYRGSLCALNKNSRGIAPIAAGNKLRCLATRVASKLLVDTLGLMDSDWTS